MNVSDAAIGEYFLLGSGTQYVYEKFGDNGTPQQPKPVIYKYNWNGTFIEGLEPDPATLVYPIKLVLNDPLNYTVVITSVPLGAFFIRDTEPDHYYQYFAGDYENKVIALKFDRGGGQYLDVALVPDTESVRELGMMFVMARKGMK